ncbi:MAG: xanthine permease, partial [Oscillospiraceae bacterium]|nr:xanthine permease [Oscillospiraceae bacterium]
MSQKNQLSYLPSERPPLLQLILYSIQQLIVIFPATVTVALLVGFDVAVTIFASGFATLCFTLVTRGKLPLYFGSSFSYISAIIALIASQTAKGASQTDAIRIAQFGIICSGLISIIAGLIIQKFGEKFIQRVLPPIITGSIAMVIGLSLAGSTIDNLVGYAPNSPVGNAHFIVGVITLL